jgi:hypothetical protein
LIIQWVVDFEEPYSSPSVAPVPIASSIAWTLAVPGAPATPFNERFKELVCLALLINLKMM